MKPDALFPVFVGGLALVFLLLGWIGYGYDRQVMLFPTMVCGLLCLFAGAELAGRRTRRPQGSETGTGPGGDLVTLAALVPVVPLVWLFGFLVGLPLFVAALVKLRGAGWPAALSMGLGTMAFVHVFFHVLLSQSPPMGILG